MLRRPLLYVAVVYTAAILIAHYAGVFIGITVLTGLLIAAIRQRIKEDGWRKLSSWSETFLWILLITFAVGIINYGLQWNVRDSLESLTLEDGYTTLNGEQCIDGAGISGRIGSVEYRDDYVQFVVSAGSGLGKSSKCLVKYYGEDEPGDNFLPGNHVEAYGKLSIPKGKRNPNCFDYRLYLKSRGIGTVMTCDSFRISHESRWNLQGWLYKWKESYLAELEDKVGQDIAGLMRAIMFGQKSEVDEDTLEAFQKNGTAHILAVSGLHIGIIYALIVKLWNMAGQILPTAFKNNGRAFFAFVSVFFLLYTILADFSPSVVRAVLMVLMHTYAQMTSHRYDLMSAAFAVSLAVMISNPVMLFNTGFQMSFLAVMTMTLAMPYVKSIYSGALAGSIAVQLGLGPFILYNFNYLSILAVIINAPVIALAGVIVPVGLMSFVSTVIPGAGIITGFSCVVLKFLCDLLVWVNDMFEIDGVTSFLIASPHIGFVAAYYLIILMFFSEAGRRIIKRKGIQAASYMAMVVIICSMMFGSMADDGFRKIDLTFVDVGQGCCMHLRAGRENYLIDGGGSDNYDVGKSILKPYLLKNGVKKIDGAFVTHLHTDHYKGICQLAKLGMIDRIYVYEGNREREETIIEETGLDREHIIYLHAGQKVNLGDGGEIRVLWPEDSPVSMANDEEDENSSSLIMRAELKGSSLIVTGDIDQEGERQILDKLAGSRELLNADMLQVAHHGSRYSSSEEFLQAVSPSLAVIQVGKNNYGHPTSEVLERLQAQGVQVCRNDESGAIGIELKKGKMIRIYKMC